MLPGIATDALVRESIARRKRRDGYTLVRCPQRPDYWFANCLVLDDEPLPDDYDRWLHTAEAEFAGLPVQRHVVMWEIAGRQGLRAYAGPLERECTTIFTTRNLPGRPNDGADVRPLISGRDWDRACDLSLSDVFDPSIEGHAQFERWRFGIYREDAERGRCKVWGAWADGELVAVTGAYANAEWVRFITPVTDPAHRLRGYFGALANAVVSDAFARFPRATVVIAARTGTFAESTYERLGFQRAGEQHALIAHP